MKSIVSFLTFDFPRLNLEGSEFLPPIVLVDDFGSDFQIENEAADGCGDLADSDDFDEVVHIETQKLAFRPSGFVGSGSI